MPNQRPACRRGLLALLAVALLLLSPRVGAEYVNFEVPHVHPMALTPTGARLLVVNTPDATLEVFGVAADGGLQHQVTMPVGLEPVTVKPRTETEAWVVNYLSDTVSIVDLAQGSVVRTLVVGDEPTDVAFAAGKAFVAVSQEDAVKVFNLADLDATPQKIDLFSQRTQALAVSPDGTRVYAVARDSGNQTTVVLSSLIAGGGGLWDPIRMSNLGVKFPRCFQGVHPPYPPLPPGIVRNPLLTDPPDGIPKVALIVQWDASTASWRDDAFQDWNGCLPIRLPDHDLFILDPGDATTPASITGQVDHLGTTLFDVSVNPADGRIFVPNTDARNFVRFESQLRGHLVDNRMSIVDPGAGNAVTVVDLNSHIDRGSDPATNLPERQASISQPGMMVWKSDGSVGWVSAIGSRKVFRMNGACTSPACIFGADRAAPDAVVTGEGPTGLALNESAGRLYVLNRFSNSIALVDTAGLTRVGEVALHDPSPPVIRAGRHFLYDGIDGSGHGDAACSSCHPSGDKDGLAWDLGNPPGALVPYGLPGDYVRFFEVGSSGGTVPCPVPQDCSGHAGFDPQKGPMTTQTLRGMIEPLHWRGDRPTMNAFNKTFVELMGTHDLGPINGEPAGFSAAEMETFRQFALGMTLPPNPYRPADDTLPNVNVTVPGHPFAGNPAAGATRFSSITSEEPGVFCVTCHAAPMGTMGGKTGGLAPGDPIEEAAAIFDGRRSRTRSLHDDLKVPHLRNLYTKLGLFLGTNAAPLEVKNGFGFSHDGAIPDLMNFVAMIGFTASPLQGFRDLATFLLYFPGDVRPGVGRNLTVPAGAPPTGSVAAESLLSILVQVGNLADPNRHCELVAMGRSAGRERTWYLDGGIGSGGLFATDVAGEPPVTTADLRTNAEGPLTFLCATLGSGIRLGADRDLDARLNGDDCAPSDPGSFAVVTETTDLDLSQGAVTHLAWSDQSAATGAGIVYDVVTGDLDALRIGGVAFASSCLAGDLTAAAFDDLRPDPAPGSGYFYVVRGRNACGAATFGLDGSADTLVCNGP